MKVKLCLLLIATQAIISTSGVPFLAAQGSCKGKCFEGIDQGADCQCNTACEQFNDCCEDYESTCLSCSGRCGLALDLTFGCQCNDPCISHGDCCKDFVNICNEETGGATDNQLTTMFAELFTIATETSEADIELNFQGQTSEGSTQDKAPANLFTKVDESQLNSGIYAKLMALMDNYNPDVTVVEDHTPAELAEEEAFLDAIMSSPIFIKTTEFLIEHKFVTSEAKMRAILKELWFELYDRDGTSKPVLGSSGFEHVFVGETKNNKVSGFHGWVHFFMEEKAKRLNYYGYISTKSFGHNIYGVTNVFKWNNEFKAIGGGFVGISPELELSLFTVCIITRPDSLCPVSFGSGKTFKIQTYRELVNGKIHVGSAYPVF